MRVSRTYRVRAVGCGAEKQYALRSVHGAYAESMSIKCRGAIMIRRQVANLASRVVQFLLGSCAGMLLLGHGFALAEVSSDPSVEEILEVPSQTLSQNQQTQRQIDQLADETLELLSEYRLKLQTLDRVQRYNANLERTIADQEREMASLDSQIENFSEFERGIVPLMMDMVDELDAFIRLDVPFSPEMRDQRVSRLREVMNRADVSVSEKYRHIMRAYLDEALAGRAINAYSGQIDTGDGTPRNVEFFQLGRVVLIYQSPDRELIGYWNGQAGEWRPLPNSYARSANLALRIARKQSAPELLTLPVSASSMATSDVVLP